MAEDHPPSEPATGEMLGNPGRIRGIDLDSLHAGTIDSSMVGNPRRTRIS